MKDYSKKGTYVVKETPTSKKLNIRKTPIIADNNVIEQVEAGDSLTVKYFTEDSVWARVTTPSGAEGFCMTEFIK